MQPIAIVGLGMVTGPQPGRTTRLLEAEAARLAIEDAGLDRSQIDGAIQARRAGGSGERPSPTDGFPRVLGLPVNFFYTSARSGGGGSLAIAQAFGHLNLGTANFVVIARGVDDYSRSQLAKEKGRRGQTTVPRKGYWGKPFGDLRAASHHSFFASRHMHSYGTRPEDLGQIAVNQRKWANLNPRAKQYAKELTLDQYMTSPYIVEPYRLFDMCQVNDGAIAIVLTTADRAADLAQKPVHVRGVGFGEMMAKLWWEKENYTQLAVAPAKERAFGQAGIAVEDLSYAQLYDCFTGEVLFQLEDYGFCGKGEGGMFLREKDLGPGGDLAINTSGGLLSAYHFGDLSGISETILQLRGQAGERQVKDGRFGLVSGHGGEVLSPGMCSLHASLVLGVD